PASLAATNEARRVAQENGDRQNETASYLVAGRALLRQGNYEEAQVNLQKSLHAAREHDFAHLEADSLRLLGVTAYDTGQLEMANQYYAQSLPLYEKLKDKQGESAVYNNLSVVAISQGNIEQALTSLEKAQQIDEAVGDREGLARILTNLSSMYMDLGAFDIAQTYARQGLELCR